ncbi:MAG TPA: isochorismatase family cysteine hydrolase, partial [Trebonia sp.]
MTVVRSVLLLMDFQHGLVERVGAPSVVDAAARAAKAARAAGIPVMFVRVAFRPGYPEVAVSNATFSAAAAHGGDSYHQDHPATQVHASLAPQDGEPVILKRRVSAFTGSDLDVLLRGAGADTLILAGISTSGVVLSTLRQAADLDYRLTVLADACADPDEEVHRVLTGKVFPGRPWSPAPTSGSRRSDSGPWRGVGGAAGARVPWAAFVAV